MKKEILKVGFIGLGDMGMPMVKNLLKAGYQVQGFDLKREKVTRCVEIGGQVATGLAEVVAKNDCICTSLPNSASFIEVAKKEFLPLVRKGQVFIDFGTTIPHKVQRLAEKFADKEATLLDVPVSGGPGGVKNRDLYMFAGGKKETIEELWPLFTAIGGENKFFYCGPSGSGQSMKGVNQLWMGLLDAALLETVAFGVRSGLAPELIAKIFNGRGGATISNTAKRVAAGQGEHIGVKFRELPYFICEAERQGFSLPISAAVYNFCNQGERVVIDDHRPAPSYWYELLLRECEKNN